jgi:hypothetical protein
MSKGLGILERGLPMEIRERLINAAQQYVYQLDDFPKKAVLAQIGKELDELLVLNDDLVLEKRLAHIGIGGKEDYLNKYIETSEGIVLAGIRHLGGNPEKPFVYMWPGFKIQNLKGIIGEINHHFEIFKPKSYSFWIRPDCNDYHVKVIQQRFIARVEELVKYDLPLSIPGDYYDWYEDQYKAFHEMRPDFIDRVTVNSKEIMDACLEQGLLYQLQVNGQIAGLIAAEREIFLGQPTVYIDEILTSTNFRGKGYASKILGSFANIVDVTYLTCHIDSENLPSTKTALRAGEEVFSQECMVEV